MFTGIAILDDPPPPHPTQKKTEIQFDFEIWFLLFIENHNFILKI